MGSRVRLIRTEPSRPGSGLTPEQKSAIGDRIFDPTLNSSPSSIDGRLTQAEEDIAWHTERLELLEASMPEPGLFEQLSFDMQESEERLLHAEIALAKTNFKLNTHLRVSQENLSQLAIDVFADLDGIDIEKSSGSYNDSLMVISSGIDVDNEYIDGTKPLEFGWIDDEHVGVLQEIQMRESGTLAGVTLNLGYISGVPMKIYVSLYRSVNGQVGSYLTEAIIPSFSNTDNGWFDFFFEDPMPVIAGEKFFLFIEGDTLGTSEQIYQTFYSTTPPNDGRTLRYGYYTDSDGIMLSTNGRVNYQVLVETDEPSVVYSTPDTINELDRLVFVADYATDDDGTISFEYSLDGGTTFEPIEPEVLIETGGVTNVELVFRATLVGRTSLNAWAWAWS
jgi:hypothetical protein